MTSLTLEQASYLAEIIGVVVVVISIIYLAIQVKQSTQAAKITAAHNVVEGLSHQYSSVALNGEIAEIFLRGMTDADSITGVEELRFYAFLHELFRAYENAHYQVNVGAMDARLMTVFSQHLVMLSNTPRMQKYWNDRKAMYSDEFQTYLDQEIFGKPHSVSFRLAGT